MFLLNHTSASLVEKQLQCAVTHILKRIKALTLIQTHRSESRDQFKYLWHIWDVHKKVYRKLLFIDKITVEGWRNPSCSEITKLVKWSISILILLCDLNCCLVRLSFTSAAEENSRLGELKRWLVLWWHISESVWTDSFDQMKVDLLLEMDECPSDIKSLKRCKVNMKQDLREVVQNFSLPFLLYLQDHCLLCGPGNERNN